MFDELVIGDSFFLSVLTPGLFTNFFERKFNTNNRKEKYHMILITISGKSIYICLFCFIITHVYHGHLGRLHFRPIHFQ